MTHDKSDEGRQVAAEASSGKDDQAGVHGTNKDLANVLAPKFLKKNRSNSSDSSGFVQPLKGPIFEFRGDGK